MLVCLNDRIIEIRPRQIIETSTEVKYPYLVLIEDAKKETKKGDLNGKYRSKPNTPKIRK